jgi:MFS family permease
MARLRVDRLAIGLFLAVSATAFETLAVGTMLPSIADEFRGDRLYGATFVVYMLANLVALVAAGERADRTGLRRPFLVGAAAFAVGLVIAGTANSMWMLLGGRALQGAGSGIFVSLSFVAVRRGYSEDRQPAMYALISTGWILPSLISPFIAGWITSTVGWRWVFIGMLPLAGIVALLAVPQLSSVDARTVLDELPERSRIPLALRIASGIALMTAASYSSRWWLVLTLASAGGVVVVIALRRLMPPGLLTARPGRPAAIAARMCAMAAFNGADFFIPLAARRVHNASPTVQGATILGAAVGWNLGQWLAVRIGARVGFHRIVPAGFIILAAGCASSIAILSSGTPLWVTAITWSVGGLGMGVLFNPTSQVGMGSSSAGAAGLASTQLNVADVFGFSVMAAVGGALVSFADQTSLRLTTALACVFVLAAAVAIIGAAAGRNVRSERGSEPAV